MIAKQDNPEAWQAEWRELTGATEPDGGRSDGDVMFADFSREDYSDWFVEGPAFGDAPAHAGGTILSAAEGDLHLTIAR